MATGHTATLIDEWRREQGVERRPSHPWNEIAAGVSWGLIAGIALIAAAAPFLLVILRG